MASYLPQDFVITPSNMAAAEMILAWPRWAALSLILVGPAGSGKRHLAHLWAAQSGAQFLKLEDLNDTFLAHFQKGAYVLPLAPSRRVLEEQRLFHFYNAAKETGSAVLYISPAPPEDLGYTLPDLRSRLKSLPLVSLPQADDALLEAIVTQEFGRLHIKISAEITRYITAHTERAPAAIRTLVSTINTRALAQGRKITLPFVREILVSL